MTSKTIFGREPAAIVGVIEAALVLASAISLHWGTDQIGAVMAVVMAVFGCYTAWVTKDTLLGVAVGLIKALLALAVTFGFHPDPTVAAALIAFATVFMSLFNRTQTSPVTGTTPVPVVPIAPVSPVAPLAPVAPVAPAPVVAPAAPLGADSPAVPASPDPAAPAVTDPSPEGQGV